MKVSFRPRRAAWAAGVAVMAQLATGAAAAPARPALDVYFLIDATASAGELDPLVRHAVDDLAATLSRRVTLRHGYGVFRDAELVPNLTVPAYERLVPVGQGKRLPDIRYAGGADAPEGHTLGLYGALGVEHSPWLMRPEAAGFLRSTRIIVVVSDQEVGEGTHRPGLTETIRRLNDAGIVVAALHVAGSSSNARGDLERLAEDTGMLATRAADCDGDGRTDLRRGAPLVCDVHRGARGYGGFADALVARLR